MLKYMVIVATSLIIVAKSPEAIAGSELIFLKKNGKPVDMKTAEVMLRNMDSPTTMHACTRNGNITFISQAVLSPV